MRSRNELYGGSIATILAVTIPVLNGDFSTFQACCLAGITSVAMSIAMGKALSLSNKKIAVLSALISTGTLLGTCNATAFGREVLNSTSSAVLAKVVAGIFAYLNADTPLKAAEVYFGFQIQES